MDKKSVYLYLMKREPARLQAFVPAHVAYWKECNLENYSGGPFADRSGGLITFEAENMEEVAQISANDPFALENLLDERWIKEWMVE